MDLLHKSGFLSLPPSPSLNHRPSQTNCGTFYIPDRSLLSFSSASPSSTFSWAQGDAMHWMFRSYIELWMDGNAFKIRFS
ncbi:hypothetical protein SLEP1_g58108 [Rubroshorea leprosula]|uniref:Uncharacterized protein n=1 Tax=Rubroshorea leprosula TaxID=152421 RepID=A0AAV5MND2_9ROSI|nr:hypothetical protein SLEP1_g58108 [Rubroshorea leprosula]